MSLRIAAQGKGQLHPTPTSQTSDNFDGNGSFYIVGDSVLNTYTKSSRLWKADDSFMEISPTPSMLTLGAVDTTSTAQQSRLLRRSSRVSIPPIRFTPSNSLPEVLKPGRRSNRVLSSFSKLKGKKVSKGINKAHISHPMPKANAHPRPGILSRSLAELACDRYQFPFVSVLMESIMSMNGMQDADILDSAAFLLGTCPPEGASLDFLFLFASARRTKLTKMRFSEIMDACSAIEKTTHFVLTKNKDGKVTQTDPYILFKYLTIKDLETGNFDRLTTYEYVRKEYNRLSHISNSAIGM